MDDPEGGGGGIKQVMVVDEPTTNTISNSPAQGILLALLQKATQGNGNLTSSNSFIDEMNDEFDELQFAHKNLADHEAHLASTWSLLVNALSHKSASSDDQLEFNWPNIALALFLVTLILSTVVGNLFVMVAILIERNLRTIGNYLVLSLALADLLVALLVMPLAGIYQILDRWTLGLLLCDIWTSADVFCCTASILHLLAIALDRYWAVTRVDYIRCQRNERRILFMILFVWMAACVISLAPVFGWKDHLHEERITKNQECLVSQDVGYQIFATCTTFYFPLILTLIFYWKIYQVARKRIRRKPGNRLKISLQHPSSSSILVGPPTATTTGPAVTSVSGAQHQAQTPAKQYNSMVECANSYNEFKSSIVIATLQERQVVASVATCCPCSCHGQKQHVKAAPDSKLTSSTSPITLLSRTLQTQAALGKEEKLSPLFDDTLTCSESVGYQDNSNVEISSTKDNHQISQKAQGKFDLANQNIIAIDCNIQNGPNKELVAVEKQEEKEDKRDGVLETSQIINPNNKHSLHNNSNRLKQDGQLDRFREDSPFTQISSSTPTSSSTQTGNLNNIEPQQQQRQICCLCNCGYDSCLCLDRLTFNKPLDQDAKLNATSSNLIRTTTTANSNRQILTRIKRDGHIVNELDAPSDDSKQREPSRTWDAFNLLLKRCLNRRSADGPLHKPQHLDGLDTSNPAAICNRCQCRLDKPTVAELEESGHTGNSSAIAASTTNIATSTVLTNSNITLTRPPPIGATSNSVQMMSAVAEGVESKRERKAAKTLAIITGVFVMCWLPFFVMAITMPLLDLRPHKYLFALLLWLGYLNSMLNPIIYTIFSPDFRKAFKRLLCGLERSRDHQRRGINSTASLQTKPHHLQAGHLSQVARRLLLRIPPILAHCCLFGSNSDVNLDVEKKARVNVNTSNSCNSSSSSNSSFRGNHLLASNKQQQQVSFGAKHYDKTQKQLGTITTDRPRSVTKNDF